MNDLGELRRENRALRDRFSRLIFTVLRINSSLDLDTVLQEVVDRACALTGASQGVNTTVDAGGGLADFVTSGLSDEEVETLVAWPEGRGCSSTCGTSSGRSSWRTCPATSPRSAFLRARGPRARCRVLRCATGASTSAPSSSATRRKERRSRRRTRNCRCRTGGQRLRIPARPILNGLRTVFEMPCNPVCIAG